MYTLTKPKIKGRNYDISYAMIKLVSSFWHCMKLSQTKTLSLVNLRKYDLMRNSAHEAIFLSTQGLDKTNFVKVKLYAHNICRYKTLYKWLKQNSNKMKKQSSKICHFIKS